MLAVDPHPLLDAGRILVRLPRPLGGIDSPASIRAGLSLETHAPMASDDAVRAAIRRLLRHGGFKPSGRNKPASEYLLRAASQGALGSINPVVDVCNVVSLHSGLPISVVDLDRTAGPLTIRVAPAGTRCVFNASGQELDLSGLVALADQVGFCANAVKDSHRTKTHEGTRRVLGVIWGSVELEGRCGQALGWFRDMITAVGAEVELIERDAGRDV
ncbi:MAG: hypothetical protein H6739_00595 [Alphaproteobacteria bacterium]|nr:hypothetical protein [Alphaproteobacteria bacterium]